jgi:hypothetical protein
MMSVESIRAFEAKARRILAAIYGPPHRWPKIRKHYIKNDFSFWGFNHYGMMSTCSNNDLTRLVLAAHCYGIRISLRYGGFRRLRVELWNRDQDGKKFTHPPLEESLGAFETWLEKHVKEEEIDGDMYPTDRDPFTMDPDARSYDEDDDT